MDKVVHFEIPVDDLERAQKFYKNVFGWKMDSLPGMEYIMNGKMQIESELGQVFRSHQTASYVGKIREIRFLSPDIALLRAVAGMVPPGEKDINPKVNAIQSFLAIKENNEWRITLFQNTPAQFHGRPELAEALTRELQELAERQKHEIVITRVFEAPCEIMWKAWTESERLAQWWGPKGFKMLVIKLDFQPGGVFHYSMRTPGGQEMWGKFVYQEIDAPEKIVFINSFADEHGNPVRNPYIRNWPLEVRNTLTLEQKDGKTLLTLRGGPINATELESQTFEEGRKSMQQGFAGTWEQLDEYLAKNRGNNQTKITAEPRKQEIIITREFDAPPDIVFKSFTDPLLFIQWLGPRELVMTLEKFEMRKGGVWRYIQKDKDGNEYAFHGVVHEVAAPERIIDTFEFEGLPEKGHVILETSIFEELPGDRTKLTNHSVFQSFADRDGMIQSGMERGVNDSYERLDELLVKMKSEEELK